MCFLLGYWKFLGLTCQNKGAILWSEGLFIGPSNITQYSEEVMWLVEQLSVLYQSLALGTRQLHMVA